MPCDIPWFVVIAQIAIGISVNLLVAVVFYQVGKGRAR